LEKIAYVNGAFVPHSEAKVSVFDRGFLFADGIYEVAAVLDGKLIDNASHLARLKRSVGEIELALPETLERIEAIQKELVKRNDLVNGMVYLEVTRGADKGRDFAFPKADVKPTLVMFTSEKDILNAAIREAQAWLAAKYDAGLPPYWEASRWTVPALPEVVTEGDTEIEALRMAEEAIRAVLEYRRDNGLPAPKDMSPTVRKITIAA